jgi:hypothetical protein
MDLLTSDMRIQALRNQLDGLAGIKKNAPVAETTEQMIGRVVEQKLAELLAPVATASTTNTSSMDYGSQLLLAVGSALTEEQQIWLSNESNRADIPRFLSSTEGQAITRRFFTSYKQFKDL